MNCLKYNRVVIIFYLLMYGVVFIAYMTTAWPYPLFYEKVLIIFIIYSINYILKSNLFIILTENANPIYKLVPSAEMDRYPF